MSEELQTQARSFLARPEGKVAYLATAAATVGGGIALYYVLPSIIVILTNLVYTAVLAGVLAGVTFAVLNRRVRLLVNYLWRSFFRWLTGKFVELDPIGIMEAYKEDLQESLGKMSEQLGTLRGQESRLDGVIKKKGAEKERAASLAAEAKRRIDGGERSEELLRVLTLQGNQMVRLDKTAAQYLDMQNRITQLLRVLDKMHSYTKLVFDDLAYEIENRKEARATIQASYGAFTSAMKILRGDPEARALFDQTTEFLDADYADKMGQIRQFIEESSGAIASMDVESGVFQSEALKQIDQWEQKTSALLTGASASRRSLTAGATTAGVANELPARVSSYSDLLNK